MNIEPAKVVSDYERNLKKGGTVSCYGVLKLLNELLEPESKPADKANIELRDRLYSVLTNGEKLFLGQNYFFEDRKPRDDLFVVLQKEVELTSERILTIKKAIRILPTSEKNTMIANDGISKIVAFMESKIKTVEKTEKSAVEKVEKSKVKVVQKKKAKLQPKKVETKKVVAKKAPVKKAESKKTFGKQKPKVETKKSVMLKTKTNPKKTTTKKVNKPEKSIKSKTKKVAKKKIALKK